MTDFNPSLSILHISDIHRTSNAHISNIELLSSLIADKKTYSNLKPKIRPIDAIVCSGDVIQGLEIGSSLYPDDLNKQYDEAYDLFSRLADHFLDGDRSKIIIVPGNHDIDWNISIQAMERIVYKKTSDVKRMIQEPHFRWSWDELALYKIKDFELYNQRLEKFCTFYKRFYSGVSNIEYVIDSTFKYSLQEIVDGVIIAGFNSCEENDCFQYSGKISSEIISECHLKIEQRYTNIKIKIAVWHHNFYGPPSSTDYMNKNKIDLLLNKGFRLGLHGHQHKSEYMPFTSYLQDEEIMAIVGAGSLTAGKNELPQGYNRQFNIIELDRKNRTVRVHIREMLVENIFSKGRRSLGGKSYIDIKFTDDNTQEEVNMEMDGGKKIKAVEDIEQLLAKEQPNKALEKITQNKELLGNYGRRLKTRALESIEDWPALTIHIGTPQNSDEFGLLFKSLCKVKDFIHAEKQVNFAFHNGLIGERSRAEFQDRIVAEKKIQGVL